PENLIYIMVTTVTTWYAALRIGNNQERQSAYLKEQKSELTREEKRAYKESQTRIRKRMLAACLLLNLGILAVVKYTNFAIANANGLLELLGQPGRLSFVTLALPMGISFYTFQAAGYLVDVYRGTASCERSLLRFALFLSFFPQLVQGPISRFGDLSRTLLYEEHSFDGGAVCRGLQRVLWGYFKKMVVADRILAGVGTLIQNPDAYGGAYVLVEMLFYTAELYADFTGGIDVTIGVAETLGVRVQENFRRPYFSKSLKEYWRRWHISMSQWFKDYLFYPVSVSGPMTRFAKFCRKRFGAEAGKRLPVYAASFLVWLATGIWHGASWNFVVWGLANWAVLMLSEELEPLYARFHGRFPVGETVWYRSFQILRTFLLVCCLNLFDCYPSAAVTLRQFGSLFNASNWSVLWDGSLLAIGLSAADYAVLAAGTAVMLGVSLLQRGGSVRERIGGLPYPARFAVWYGLFVAVLLLGIYGVGYDASQFIYNQF
ncbi:MAG: MBOAT family O-acyltransferase, partial [Eubacteriales bacterium]|nr:MBOAT family O-acyltransferase [Eubacteriales bacterium]